MDTYAVIDFETTGLSPNFDRAIEVGVVIVRNHKVIESFGELMDPGFVIPSHITSITGISTAMVKGKPNAEIIMPRVREFIGSHLCVAHNASFDRGFLSAEMKRARIDWQPQFLCSMLLARRLVQTCASHKLGCLVQHLGLPVPAGMRAHRALADCLMTVELWSHLMKCIQLHIPDRPADLDFLTKLSRTPKGKVEALLERA